MERRVLDITEGNCFLSKQRGSLAIVRNMGEPTEKKLLVPFDEIESVVVNSPHVSYSNGALLALAKNAIPLVCCNSSHVPTAWLWPTEANFEQGRRITAQAATPKWLRDALWARIVRTKLEAQAAVVRDEGFANEKLIEFSRNVQSGDSTNLEAQGARIYWKCLFDEGFRRRRYGSAPNGLLNYGYAILRATVARQICAVGLHPSLSLHHHNRFNPMCLADDFMEPFRPIVDCAVLTLWKSGFEQVTKETKPVLVSVMTESVRTERGDAPVSRCIEWAAQSLANSFLEGEDLLRLPKGSALVE
ncbi:MAG: type II CRISPR-associated endonuclease Cas1 [Acidimicrobiia bacterium]|nr:type II CRISPR-associated endonuclease Cas1 [Acidimicrobiia bacterium]MCY4457821.1 type II CRISPR-associated endonuclease Cas1 [Acidimicrobiaceae bacterium]